MPWPMVHFTVAEQLVEDFPSPELLMGSIAPDAIHVRGHITREEKGATHLVEQGRLPSKERIMEKYRYYDAESTERTWRDFVLGYFSHLYTDLRWTESLYTDFENSYTGDPKELREVYNREVSQLEFELMRANPAVEKLFTELEKSGGFTINPFLEQQEVGTYRDTKLKWLRNPDHEPKVGLHYFRVEDVQKFIRRTAMELKELL